MVAIRGELPADLLNAVFDLPDANSIAAVKTITAKALACYGLRYFGVAGLPAPAIKFKGFMLLDERLPAWSQHFEKHDLYKHDPVAAHARRTMKAFTIGDLVRDSAITREQKRVLGEMSDYKIANGLISPVGRMFGLPEIFFALGERADVRKSVRKPLHLLSIYAHTAVMRLHARNQAPINRLTQREREILTAYALGEKSLSIAERLEIEEGTVQVHLTNVKLKLKAESRARAVVIALRSGEITC